MWQRSVTLFCLLTDLYLIAPLGLDLKVYREILRRRAQEIQEQEDELWESRSRAATMLQAVLESEPDPETTARFMDLV